MAQKSDNSSTAIPGHAILQISHDLRSLRHARLNHILAITQPT